MKRLTSILLLAILFFAVPLNADAAQLLVPVGKIVGIQLKTGTVIVAAFDDVLGKNAKAAGLKIGDQIIKINQKEILGAEDVRTALMECGGTAVLTVRRGSKQCEVRMEPKNTEEGYKLGVYLRQGISGVGTVTWYDPASGCFGALGHGVNTSGGNLLEMASGSAYRGEVLSVKKGKSGQPGQLKGTASADNPCGILKRNTPQGIFGTAQQPWTGEPIPAAQWDELTTGPAKILSTINGSLPQEYSVEIVKIYSGERPDGRNLLLHVTDPELLETTGGIVQGMSGSPIIQNGRLVGAVTHVLVNDPTMGYGIFIQKMLDAAG